MKMAVDSPGRCFAQARQSRQFFERGFADAADGLEMFEQQPASGRADPRNRLQGRRVLRRLCSD